MLETIKVIIVDDSKLTRIGLKATLSKKETIEVVGEADNGLEGVNLAHTLLPDVILMDIGMPILDGIQATAKIRELRLPCKTIVLTSHDSEKDVLDALKSGANSYCMKDIDPDMLVSVIQMTHNGASWLDPSIANLVLKNIAFETSSEGQTHEKSPGEPCILTDREVEILKLVSNGCGNQEIADKLYISLNTVKTHIKNIFHKLEVDDRTEAVMKAFQDEII